MEIRTRFAPSPTGFLHIGGLKTALFAYLIARTNNGKYVLRIEDTDNKREIEGAVKGLMDILDWAGLVPDEGPVVRNNQLEDKGEYGPYVQSSRQVIYDKYKAELLEKGGAYHCFCSAEHLQEVREGQQAAKLPPRYDRKCRDLSKEQIEEKIKAGEQFVIRQKMPLDGVVRVYDELRGEIIFKAEELEDHVLIKSSGIPTYQFANVVDDHLMAITHVSRADEWIPSFPKNILLYKAFGWESPKFIHLTLILDKAGGKLSKRKNNVAVEDYRREGYLKEALINFCALLGWHPKDDQEILSLDDLIKKFRYEDMGISPAIFDIDKLDYLNGYYIRQKSINELVELCKPYLVENLKLSSNNSKKTDEFVAKVIKTEQERLKKLSEIGELTEFLFKDEIEYDTNLLVWKKTTLDEMRVNLEKIYLFLNEINEDNWNREYLEAKVIEYLKSNELKIGDHLWPTRVALSGKQASPGPFEIADVLGKKETLERIQKAIKK